ncbi:MAG: CBS domain-containing protein [Magnetococcus sp. YQC-5]
MAKPAPATAPPSAADNEKAARAAMHTALTGAMPSIPYAKDALPMPDDPGSVVALMTESPFTLKEDERVIVAINAMRHDGYRYMGIERNGKLIRVVSQSDLRQIMGPFFGTKAMNARDKAICNIPIGKINEAQKPIVITLDASITAAANLMAEHRLHALPVVSGPGVLRGFVTIHAVLNYFRRKRQA